MAKMTRRTVNERSWVAENRERWDSFDESLKSGEEYENDVGEVVSNVGGMWDLKDANAAICSG